MEFTAVGTEGYKPPEMERRSYNTLQADMFAVGVVVFIMYKGNIPFRSSRSADSIYKYIRESDFYGFWKIHSKGRSEEFF